MGKQSERLSETRFPPYPPDSSRYYKPPVYRRNDSEISPCKHQRDSICMLCRIQFYLLKRNNQNTSDVWRKTTNSVYLRRPDSHHREKEMHSPALQQLKAELTSQNQTASQSVHRLAKLMNALDQRGNLLMSTILNGLLFWELRQVMQIEKWKEAHSADLPRWIEAIGAIDAYCSLATFSYNHPDYIYPQITSQSFHLQAEALGHPLMDRNKCVRNGIDMEKRPFFIIITGANMAGKSTYLRTVGVNYLLACIGAPVWAAKMEIFPARLVTSLRTSDSLTDNESYFFAELKRLKLIIDKLKAGEELFIILDEILKGTNSMDKQKGSFALIKQFMSMDANGIIATHDLLLGTLIDAFPQNIRNYCFEADITNNELTFSYQMRSGIAQNMNACFLMKNGDCRHRRLIPTCQVFLKACLYLSY